MSVNEYTAYGKPKLCLRDNAGGAYNKMYFDFTSGGEFPDDLTPYTLVVHCGGCMLNEAEMKHRVERARNANVPIVNYGIAIAHMHGILKRSLEPFRDMEGML